jgi:hypothetical protein
MHFAHDSEIPKVLATHLSISLDHPEHLPSFEQIFVDHRIYLDKTIINYKESFSL